MLEKRRCHFTYIFELLAKYFFQGIVVIGVFCFEIVNEFVSDEQIYKSAANALSIINITGDYVYLFLALLVVAAALAIALAFCTFKWAYTYLIIENDALICQSGKFIKRSTSVPFDKINTIDLGQNLFERLVGTCRLKIDTGAYSKSSENHNKSEVNLVFKLEDSEKIRSFILSQAAIGSSEEADAKGKKIIENKEPHWAVQAKMSDFMLYGFTSSSVFKLFCILLLVFCFVIELPSGISEYLMDAVLKFAESAIGFVELYSIISTVLFIALASICLSLITKIFTIIWSAVRFYGFSVAREGRNVIVRYGFFTKKNYTLQVRNIHAVVVHQNMIQQIVGLCSVSAVCIGFGDEESETEVLFPIIKKRKLNELLSVILPEYVTEMNLRPRRKAGIVFHAVIPTILWSTAGIIFCALCSFIMDSIIYVSILILIIVLCRMANGILSYFHNTIDWNDRVISVQDGGFTKTVYRIRTDAVQEIQLKTNPIKQRLGIGSYYVHFHGPVLNNTSYSSNISGDYFPELVNAIED